MRIEPLIICSAVVLVIVFTAVGCGTKPGSEEETQLIQNAIDEGADPLDAIYQANMTTKAGTKTVARMTLELVKQLREHNETLAEIRDELRAIRQALPTGQ